MSRAHRQRRRQRNQPHGLDLAPLTAFRFSQLSINEQERQARAIGYVEKITFNPGVSGLKQQNTGPSAILIRSTPKKI